MDGTLVRISIVATLGLKVFDSSASRHVLAAPLGLLFSDLLVLPERVVSLSLSRFVYGCCRHCDIDDDMPSLIHEVEVDILKVRVVAIGTTTTLQLFTEHFFLLLKQFNALFDLILLLLDVVLHFSFVVRGLHVLNTTLHLLQILRVHRSDAHVSLVYYCFHRLSRVRDLRRCRIDGLFCSRCDDQQ